MKNKKQRSRTIAVFVFVCIVSLLIVSSTILNISNAKRQQRLLEESIESQITSVCITALEIIHEYPFDDYNSMADVNANPKPYYELREKMRDLADDTNVTYLYALKYINGKCLFVLDSDTEDEEVFISYETSPIHDSAFKGKGGAGVMNVIDEYGSFNGGALPIVIDNQIVGIICVDIEDSYVEQSRNMLLRNSIISTLTMIAVLVIMTVFTSTFYRRVRREQSKLEQMALFDSVTGLPNRQHFFQYAKDLMKGNKKRPFVLLFTDLDNFKQINDTEGHDEGDVILYEYGQFLKENNDAWSEKLKKGTAAHICARIGGDEFLYLLEGITDEEQAKEVAASILSDFTNAPFKKYINSHHFGVSIGMALYPAQGSDLDTLIGLADEAMYTAKKDGKGNFHMFKKGED